MAEFFDRDFDADFFAFSGSQSHSFECLKLLEWALNLAFGTAYIDLYNLVCLHLSKVPERECQLDGLLAGLAAKLAIFEVNVRQSVTECVHHRYLLGLKPSVAYEDAFAVDGIVGAKFLRLLLDVLAVLKCEKICTSLTVREVAESISRGVLKFERECEWKFT